ADGKGVGMAAKRAKPGVPQGTPRGELKGKPKPFSPLAAPSALSKQSRIPRAPYAEAKANAKKQGAGAGGESGSKGQGEEGGDKPFLKVDPELVVTVLGDLEQLLFSQML
uniref:Neuron navigator 1b n=1 Tax=Gasterosteus aculeatus TaxID=69293 RepID=G3NMV2_GASAC